MGLQLELPRHAAKASVRCLTASTNGRIAGAH